MSLWYEVYVFTLSVNLTKPLYVWDAGRNKITHEYCSFHYCYEWQEWKELSLATTYSKQYMCIKYFTPHPPKNTDFSG
jgi:hypothetical protein